MITKKDKIFLRTIQTLTASRRGIPPSFRELQSMLGLKSINPVFWRIQKLRTAGAVEAHPHRARTIHLTQSGIRILKDDDDMTPQMELSDEEKAIILERREESERKKRTSELNLEILKVAYEYEKWLQENEHSSTYSTFCDEFGYEGNSRSERSQVFACVQDVLHLVKKMM